MTRQTATPSDAQPALTPKLRLPKFRDAAGWELTTLGKITTKTDRKNREGTSYPIYSINNEVGFIPQSEQFEGVDSHQRGYDISIYKVIDKHTFAYNPARINVGSIGYSGELKDILISSLYVCFKTTDEVDDEFLLRFFSTTTFRKAVRDSAEGGIRSYLFYENLSKIGIPLPRIEEQQKIAECLSTLDELLGSESQKLDALKAHKKGLMLELFPREGETLPRLRFPEFHSAPEWKSDTIGGIFDTSSGGTPSRSEKTFWDGDIPWITTSLVDFRVIIAAEEHITEDGLEGSSAKLFPKGTVLMAMYGQGKTRGQVALLGIEAATNQACAAILPKNGIDPYFVFLSLAGRYEEIREMSNSGGQENLSQGLVQKIPFAFPPDEAEQRKVTTCLSSLDDLIAAQSDRLSALRTHKQGLLQQLFPSPADASS